MFAFLLKILFLIAFQPTVSLNENVQIVPGDSETTDNFPKDWNITFNLFKQNDRQNQIVLNFTANDTTIKNSGYDSNLKTKIIVHGWTSGYYVLDMFGRQWMRDLKDFILDGNDFNVICVDWSKPASNSDYSKVLPRGPTVGAMIANFINRLINLMNASTNDMQCIGHSMGAQICGFVGKKMRTNKLAHISGLDPAGLGFDGSSYERTPLDSSDANLVVVIHTASGFATHAGLNIAGFIGHSESLGHYDFRINGGNIQPMCHQLRKKIKALKNLLNLEFSDAFSALSDAAFCPHDSVYKYAIAKPSNGCQFIAYQCNAYHDFKKGKCAEKALPMELNFEYYDNPNNKLNQTQPPNNLYMKTSESYPYCLFHYQIVVEIESQLFMSETIDLSLFGIKQVDIKMRFHRQNTGNIYYMLYTNEEELGTVYDIKYKSERLKINYISINYMSHIDESVRKEKSSKPVIKREGSVIFGVFKQLLSKFKDTIN